MRLYGFPPSPRTWAVRAVAAQLGVPIDFEFVDLTKGQQHAPAYRALNPNGRAPTLVDGDFKLWEATAIMHYLAGQKPTALWPDDMRIRADIVRWQSWNLAHWEKDACAPLLFERVVKQIVGMGAPDEAIVARALENFARDAKVLDAHLAKQPYLVGQTLTLADFSVAGPLFYAERRHADRRLSETVRMVRPRRGAAVLEGNSAAGVRRRGVSHLSRTRRSTKRSAVMRR